jgi:prevent-host-death family protein
LRQSGLPAPNPKGLVGDHDQAVHLCTVTYNLIMASMSASEARAALPELLNRVEDGEEVVITRHGRPVAVLVRPDALRVRRAEEALDDAARIHALLAEAAAAPLPEGTGLTEQRAEELIAEIRASRDAR